MTVLFDIILVAWLVSLALHIASARDDQGAIIGFIAFGLLLSIGWVRLQAIDVALTEAAIGSGVTGLILLRAYAHMRDHAGTPALPGAASKPWAIVLAGFLAAGLAAIVLLAPTPPPSLAPEAAASMAKTGLGNPVTAVLLAFRALDTLLEKVVLILALVGVWSLSADESWGGAPEVCPTTVPEPLAYLARAVPPIGLVVAVYLFWVGADHPGGAFQGGTVMAAMWILVMLTGIRPAPELRSQTLRFLLIGGPVVFIAVGIVGTLFAGSFLAYPPGIAKLLIVLLEIPVTLSIAVALGMLVAGPAKRAPAP